MDLTNKEEDHKSAAVRPYLTKAGGTADSGFYPKGPEPPFY